MKVLSFDVGIKTMSFALLKGTSQADFKVLNLGTWNLGNAKDPLSVLIDVLIDRLDNAVWQTDADRIDVIAIEQQPFIGGVHSRFACVRNQVLSHVLQVYHRMNGHTDVRFVHPSHKLKVYHGPPVPVLSRSKYTQRKKLSVSHALSILQALPDQNAACMQITNSTKPDDMTDALLQGLYIMDSAALTDVTPCSNPKVAAFFTQSK